MNDLLEAALRYAALGWRVFPVHSVRDGKCTCTRACGSPAKHPLISGGVYAATTDAQKIEEWWGRWPWANVGIATGMVSGFFVLDVDYGKGGSESLEELLQKYGHFQPTATARTGGGGLHVLCQYPGYQIRNRVAIAPGLDIRGDGGYIVAPPSLHISGNNYEWETTPW